VIIRLFQHGRDHTALIGHPHPMFFASCQNRSHDFDIPYLICAVNRISAL
jgi:hypothetical protein